MAMDKIKRSFTWLRRSLEIIDKTTLPGQILDEVRPGLDTFGWDVPEYEFVTTATGGATNLTRLPNVPEGEAHLFLACDVSTDDPVGTKDVSIAIENIANSNVTLEGTVSIPAGSFLSLTRPILVTSGSNLMGLARIAIPIGQIFTVRGMFIRLQPGEYLASSPFG